MLVKMFVEYLDFFNKKNNIFSMDKIHYYDGKFYKRIIDPNLEGLRKSIIRNIQNCSKAIDIGCGTGALAIELSKICNFVVGLDLSSKMIEIANKTKQEQSISNISFIHGGTEELKKFKDKEFDFATFSMSLHEMELGERVAILNEAFRISKYVLIADYLIPSLDFFSYLGVIFIEFVAGLNHFKNYLNYRGHGGVPYLTKITNAKVLKREIYSNIIEIVILSR